MLDFADTTNRALTGLKVTEDEFNLDMVFMNAHSLVEKYELKYDAENPVPSSNAMADRCFEAALDFVAEVGILCRDTGRVIKFTREEAGNAVADAPGKCVMGKGKDRRTWRPRKPESRRKPWFHVGTGVFCTEEEYAYALSKAYASIEDADSISCPAIKSYDGNEIRSGTPTEILGAIRGVELWRKGTADAGRPGVAIGNLVSTAGTHTAAIAASAEQFGLRNSDSWLVGFLAEMKLDMSVLNKAAFLHKWGANIANESGPHVGGYAGGPAEVAILNVAYRIVGQLVFGCSHHLTFPIHITRGCSTSRDVLWCVALSNQAIARNTKELVWSLGYVAGGAMTKQYFYETAAYSATAISSGVSNQTCHPARAVVNDGVTPMEMAASVEITKACVGMKRKEANELVKKLLPLYENSIDDAPKGSTFPECFDVATCTPCEEYVDLYDEVKKELRDLGLPLA